MPAEYPYLCGGCGRPWSVIKSFADSNTPEPCPRCGIVATEQDYAQKNIGSHVNTEGDWSGGKHVIQLPANHPDSIVNSKRKMEKVYTKHGISLETGKFESKEAQIAATVPLSRRKGKTPKSVGGM